jgi:hypothetical protein
MIGNGEPLCKYLEDKALVKQNRCAGFSSSSSLFTPIIGEPSLRWTASGCVEGRIQDETSFRDLRSSYSLYDVEAGTPVHYCLEEGIAFASGTVGSVDD